MEITTRKVASAKGDITIFRLVNSKGAWVELSTLGAGIIGVGVPDRDGNIENVLLGYADPQDYIYDGPCMGKVAGRYANRIDRGHLEVAGETYQLAVNCGPHHLHGGPEGFQNQNWEATQLEDGVKFTYISKDGEENYPGELKVTVTYRWNDDNVLSADFQATTDRETVVNLTNHAYWNLRGADSGSALDHELRIRASKWLPTNRTQIPTGTFAGVGGGPMDFRVFKRVGEDLRRQTLPLQIGKGYDHCWALDGWNEGEMIKDAVVMREPVSGRSLSISSDQPGVQIYTGNWLSGSAANRSGGKYEDYDGVAIEMQGFPDAPNHPEFPSQTLRPGEVYHRRIEFAFSAY